VGFALENFNAWDSGGEADADGQPVDPSAALPAPESSEEWRTRGRAVEPSRTICGNTDRASFDFRARTRRRELRCAVPYARLFATPERRIPALGAYSRNRKERAVSDEKRSPE
jgi:hypothetical protein